jgi:hypothetical protein
MDCWTTVDVTVGPVTVVVFGTNTVVVPPIKAVVAVVSETAVAVTVE